MRLLSLVILVLWASAAAAVEAPADTTARAPRVPWVSDRSWADLRAEAAEHGRPILIDFTAAWCGPCKLLDVMVFTEKPVIAALSDVVTVKVDIDRPGADDLPGRFDVQVVPTLVWCDADGVERDRFTGYVSSAEFLETLGSWRGGLTLDQSLAARMAASPESPTVLLEVARREVQRGRRHRAEVAFRRLMNLRDRAAPPVVAQAMLGLAELEHADGQTQRARDLTARATDIFVARAAGGGDVAELVPGLVGVAEFQAAGGDTLGSLTTWRRLTGIDSRNPAVLEGYARAALAAGRELPEATKAALRATVYSDKDDGVIAVLAECYLKRGLLDRAERWAEQAVERAPEDDRHERLLERIAAARAARRR